MSQKVSFFMFDPDLYASRTSYLFFRFKWIGAFVANGILLLACFITSGVLIDYYDASPLFFENNELSLVKPK